MPGNGISDQNYKQVQFLIEKEDKKRRTIFARKKLKLTSTIILQVQQNSHIINIG